MQWYEGKKISKETQKKIINSQRKTHQVYEKTYSKKTKRYTCSLNIGETYSPETKKLLSNINSVPKRKALQKEIFKRSKKQ